MARCRVVGTNEGLTAREPMDKTASSVREANRAVVQVEYLLVKVQALGRVVCQCVDRRSVQRGRCTAISRNRCKGVRSYEEVDERTTWRPDVQLVGLQLRGILASVRAYRRAYKQSVERTSSRPSVRADSWACKLKQCAAE